MEIMTRSKKMFDPLRPDGSLIDIADIAHSLSMLCRANGHFQSFYSVGQHSINCMREAAARAPTMLIVRLLDKLEFDKGVYSYEKDS